jgi:hypothetical protein
MSVRHARRDLEERSDNTPLVLSRNGRMSRLAERQAKNTFFQEHRELPRVEQPFEEVGRSKVGHLKARPIEHLLRDPGFLAGIACRRATGRTLRQIDDRGHAGFLRGSRELAVASITPGETG